MFTLKLETVEDWKKNLIARFARIWSAHFLAFLLVAIVSGGFISLINRKCS